MPFKFDSNKLLKRSTTHVSVETLNRNKVQNAKTAFKVKNILKNVTFKIILGVRSEKTKPKISDIIRVFH